MASSNNVTNGLIRCPFDQSHMIEPARMPFHITKCKKNAKKDKEQKKKTCPFNSSHVVDSVDLDNHVKECPDRATFDVFKYHVGESFTPIAEIVESSINVVEEENWDIGGSQPGYNPITYLESNESKVMSVLRGATPSERRKHRNNQRMNFTGRRDV